MVYVVNYAITVRAENGKLDVKSSGPVPDGMYAITAADDDITEMIIVSTATLEGDLRTSVSTKRRKGS